MSASIESSSPLRPGHPDFTSEPPQNGYTSELFRYTAELARVGGWELAIDGMVPFWSDEALRIHRLGDGSELTLEAFIETYPKPAQKAVHAVIEGAIQYGEPWDIDLPFEDESGQPLWIRSMGRALWADGKVYRLVGAFQDITEPKLAEQQLNRYATDAEEARARVEQQAEQLLEQAVDLERARSEALESARMKSEFLANMSHEIRTPMNGIVGMAELLESSELDAEQREFLRTIRFSADSLLTIINDILDFSKIEAGKLAFESVVFDLEECVEEAVGLFVEQAGSKRTQLACMIDRAAPRLVVGDPGRLRQVLLNLLSNAVKFTVGGDVELQVTVLEMEDDGIRLRFSVRDSGIGIARQTISSLFSPFTQADGSTTRKYGGTGLGLAICKQLAEGMSGRIGVESEPGKGSTFWFTALLGCVDEETGPEAQRNLEGLRVLGLERHEPTRLSLESDLELWGGVPLLLGDTAEFVSILREHRQDYDVILMEGSTAEEVVNLLQAKGLEAAQVLDQFVILTGTSPHTLPTDIGGVEIADRVRKPFKRGRLYTLLRNVGKRHAEIPVLSTADLVDATSVAGLRVLVAEDNPVNQRVAMKMLSKLGCEGTAAANGLEALLAITTEEFDIVLMDCQMPEMDGFEASRKIRELHLPRRLPILALTANAMQGDRERCLEAGMDDYLTKPVELKALAEAIARWSHKSRD